MPRLERLIAQYQDRIYALVVIDAGRVTEQCSEATSCAT